jgi:transcriptional regulator with XRE-family HTH domain
VRQALGRRVRDVRVGLRLSQEQLAERADLHWTHISGIERGQYDLKLTTLCRVARGLGLSLSGLFEGIAVGGRGKTVSKRTRKSS